MDYSIIKDKAEDFRVTLQRLLPTMLNTAVPGIIDTFSIGEDGVPRVSAIGAIRLKYIDPDTQTVTYLDYPKIENIPVAVSQCEGLGLSLTVPIKQGQLCTLIFSQRSLDNFSITGELSNPTSGADELTSTVRCFDYTDAMCFPGIMTPANNITSYSEEAIEIRNADSSVKVAVYSEKIELTQGESVLTMESGNTTLTTGTFNINGSVVVSGAVSASGTISSDSDVLAAGISGATHVHGGVTSGGSMTSTPQ